MLKINSQSMNFRKFTFLISLDDGQDINQNRFTESSWSTLCRSYYTCMCKDRPVGESQQKL